MEVAIVRNENETLVTLVGRLDTTTATYFEQQIATLYTQTVSQIIFECAALEYISSSGLRVFLTLMKSVNKNQGKMKLRNLRPDLKSVFDMTGLSTLFLIE